MSDADAALSGREVRLALVLNGGVSLAVWMGGVVREIDAARRAGALTEPEGTDSFWQELTEFLDSPVSVDVIAGTSAGGINGALLATAIARGAPLPNLRQTWIELADFDSSLLDKDPRSKRRSVLKGGFFLESVQTTFQSIGTVESAIAARDVTLFLTGTALRGQRTMYTDQFGQVFTEADSRVRFVFRRGDGQDAFAVGDADSTPSIARAARATASFPGAFEPAFINNTGFIAVPPTDTAAAEGPNMSPLTGLTSNRWVIDGGVLDNEPFAPLLQEIATRPVSNDVDRYIAYIVPALGEALGQFESDDPGSTPGLVAAAAAAFQLPRELGIVNNLTKIDELLQSAEGDAAVRHRLLRAAINDELAVAAASLFPYYRARRRDAAIWEVRLLASRNDGDETIGLAPVPALEELGNAGLNMPWIPDELVWADGPWRWGYSVADRLLRVLLGEVREQLSAPPGMVDEARLPELREAAVEICAGLSQLAAMGKQLEMNLKNAATPDEATQLPDSAILALAEARYRLALGMSPADVGSTTLADVVLAAGQSVIARDALAPAMSAALPAGDVLTRSRALINRCLQAEVVERAAAPTQLYRPTPRFTFHRFGLNAATPFLDDDQVLRNKLTGTRMYHFGAFFRRSWRAYDWTWGRLDGSSHLINLLVSERSLRRVLARPSPVSAVGEAAPTLPTEPTPEIVSFAGDMATGADLEELTGALHALSVNLASPASQAQIASDLQTVRRILTKRVHRSILEEEIPAIQELEPNLAAVAGSGTGQAPYTDDYLRITWSTICSRVISTSVKQLTLDPEGRAVVGTTLASALRAVANDDISIPSMARFGLRRAAGIVRLFTSNDVRGWAARAVLVVATFVAIALTVRTPLGGWWEVILKAVAGGMAILLVSLCSLLLVGFTRRWFRRSVRLRRVLTFGLSRAPR